jgi:hypothetical protein
VTPLERKEAAGFIADELLAEQDARRLRKLQLVADAMVQPAPPSDDGLRRALLALADAWRPTGARGNYYDELHKVLRDFDTPQRNLTGQGAPSVGSSAEVLRRALEQITDLGDELDDEMDRADHFYTAQEIARAALDGSSAEVSP